MLPEVLRPVLYSYDIANMDVQKDAHTIIPQVMNEGDFAATNWLLGNYSHQEIIREANKQPLGFWLRKSRRFWEVVLGVQFIAQPRTERFL